MYSYFQWKPADHLVYPISRASGKVTVKQSIIRHWLSVPPTRCQSLVLCWWAERRCCSGEDLASSQEYCSETPRKNTTAKAKKSPQYNNFLHESTIWRRKQGWILQDIQCYCMPLFHNTSYITTILQTTISQSDKMNILCSLYILLYPNRPLVPQWTALNPWGEKRGFILNILKLLTHAHKQQQSRKGYTAGLFDARN